MIEGFTPPQTPLLMVPRAALERNLMTMQGLCRASNVRLRAHGKTHKCSTLGRLQVERGAVGLCAQSVGEAEAFVRGGVLDVLVTRPGWPSWRGPAPRSGRRWTTRYRSSGWAPRRGPPG
jgi:D-serine deaminase-like pyridoxal phosphate-dependent protein